MKKLLIFIFAVFAANSVLGQTYVWTQKTSLPGTPRAGASSFSINNEGYVMTGLKDNPLGALNDLWKWTQATDTWTQLADLPDTGRYSSEGFTIGKKCYIATGWTWGPQYGLQELYEYNTTTNSWKKKSSFPGSPRYTCSSFVLGGNAYVGMGYAPLKNDMWAYNANTNAWTQKASLPAAPRQSASGFALNGKGYIACGNTGSNSAQLWQYTPGTNTWIQRADFPGAPRYACSSFILNGKAFVGNGSNGSVYYNDFYSYDPNSNSWTPQPSFPIAGRTGSADFSLNGRGYVATGLSSAGYLNDLWEFGPVSLQLTVTFTHPSCHGASDATATAVAAGGTAPYSYSWSNGATTVSVSGIVAGQYVVTATDANGTTGSATVIVTSPPPVQVTVTAVQGICKGQQAVVTASASGGSAPYSYQWQPGNLNGSTQTISPVATSTYTVIVTDNNGCSQSQTVTIHVFNAPGAPISAENSGIACLPDSVKLWTNANAGFAYQWRRNGVNINGAVDSVYYAKTSGTYKVLVTNQNGCTKLSAGKVVTAKLVVATINPSGTVTICQGSSIVLNAVPSTGYIYQWRKNGNNINGATSSSYTATTAGTYTVNLIDPATKCSDLSPGTVVVINCRTGGSAGSVQVYPNPSSTSFTFDLGSLGDSPVNLKLVDLTGRLIMEYTGLSNTQPLTIGEELHPGAYVAVISQDGNISSYRIIKTE